MDERRVCCEKRNVILDAEAVAVLLDQIPIAPELKASEELIVNRLTYCFACEALKERVLCAYCGCFIRFKARALKQSCPHPAGEKWTAVKENYGHKTSD
jgi:hypothetical protein